MGTPAGDYSVIGWLFEAKDEASPVAQKLQDLIEVVVGAVRGHLEDASDAVDDTLEGVAAAVSTTSDKLSDSVLTPLGILKGTLKVGISTALAGFKGVGTALQFMGQTAAGAAVRVNEVLQKFISLETIGKGISAVGGVFGMIFGPFGGILMKILSLFSPIVDMVVDGLMPAVETFTSIVKTAFNPLFELAEVMAQTLAPMVVKIIEPLVSMLEVAAVQAAFFVASLLKGGKGAGVIASLFQSVGPLIMDIFRALGGLAEELLPVVVDLFVELVPVVGEVLKIVAKMVADILPVFGETLVKTLPPLLRAVLKLVEVILPVLPKLLEVFTAVVTKLVSPALIKAAEGISVFITEFLIPFIDDNMPKLLVAFDQIVALIEKAADLLGKDGIGATLGKFKAMYLDPIVKWAKEAVDSIFDNTMVGRLTKRIVDGFFAALKATTTGESTWLNELGGAVGATFDEHGVMGVLRSAVGLPPGAADGAIFESKPGGQTIRVAEAGAPEAAVPLTPEGVTKFMQPVLGQLTLRAPNVQLPGLEKAVSVLENIYDLLQKQVAQGMRADEGGWDEMGQLNSGPGLMGLRG